MKQHVWYIWELKWCAICEYNPSQSGYYYGLTEILALPPSFGKVKANNNEPIK